ncbi:hypothetical protein [Kitasatospora camelliae]|uniref:WD40 repeat protein n=1 Tax=Kitasatospora camelliae TaxID=3156397 RepID=A0AAU8JVX0_9ACTN
MTEDASWVPPLRAGRKPAGQALFGWLEDSRAPRVCRIAGSSGSGRTHLLNWLATAAPPNNPRPSRRVHAYLNAAGHTARSAAWTLADRLRLAASTPARLAATLKYAPPRVLVIADLNRAAEPERLVTDLIALLLLVPDLRLAVECADGTPEAAALAALEPRAAVLDLDDPRWTDPDRFAAWCAKLPGSPPPAEQVHPGPGLAQLAARIPGGVPLDPATPLADRLDEAAAAWWHALPEDLRPTVRALAAVTRPALAEEWATLPGSGGPDAVRRAGDLLPPHPDGLSWRLHLDPLTRLATADAPVDHAALARDLAAALPAGPDGRPDPTGADPDRLGLLLRHAAAAGTAAGLLADPRLAAAADPLAVTAALHTTPAADTALADAWSTAGQALLALDEPGDRATVLHAWQHGTDPDRDRALAAALPARPRWYGLWRHRPQAGVVRGLTAGRGPYAGRVLVATDAGVQVLDAYTGQPAGPALRPLPVRPTALACGEDGAVLALGGDGTLTGLPSPAPSGAPRTATAVAGWAVQQAGGGLTALAAPMIDGNPLVVVGDGTGRITCFHTPGQPGVATDKPLHDGGVTAVAVAELGDVLMVVSGGRDGTMRLWKPGQDPLATPLTGRPSPVTAVAAGDTDHGPVYLTAWADGTVRLLRLTNGDTEETHLRLGSAVDAATIDPTGRIHLATLDAVHCIYLPPTP